MATVADILEGALSVDAASRADVLTVEEPELVRVVNRLLAKYFLLGMKRNPAAFGTSLSVNYDGTSNPAGWPLPTTLFQVVRVEGDGNTLPVMAAGTEIGVTRIDDKAALQPQPAVCFWSRTLIPNGLTGDPTGGKLTVLAVSMPTQATVSGDPIDPRSRRELQRVAAR